MHSCNRRSVRVEASPNGEGHVAEGWFTASTGKAGSVIEDVCHSSSGTPSSRTRSPPSILSLCTACGSSGAEASRPSAGDPLTVLDESGVSAVVRSGLKELVDYPRP